MKTKNLFLAMLFMICASAIGKEQMHSNNDAYLAMRNQTKEYLCKMQNGLMKKADYLEFVESYLHKAECSLAMLRYLQKKTSFTAQDKQYLACLLSLNVAIFNNQDIEYAKSNLKKAILAVKTDNDLTFDLEQEARLTEEILTSANHQFALKIKPQIRHRQPCFNFGMLRTIRLN